MAVAPSPLQTDLEEPDPLPRLQNGDRLDQRTYHALYEATPEHIRAQLIGGIVFMSRPVGRRHSRTGGLAYRWLAAYEEDTPGTETFVESTVILGPESEPEPDAFLRVMPEFGGRTQDPDDYVHG